MAVPVWGKAADAVLLGGVPRPPPGQAMAEELVKSKVRSRVTVRVGADCGTGAGDRAGRRGALGQKTQWEDTTMRYPPTARLCMGIFVAHFPVGH